MNTNRRNNNNRNRFSILFPILTIIGIGIVIGIVTNYKPNWSYNWSGIRSEIKDSIKIAELRGTKSRWIMKNATESELLKLTDYPNGTVKGIAYEGLLRKKDFDRKTELTLKAINDTIYQIEYPLSCSRWNVYIGEYLVQNILIIDNEIPSPEILPDFGLTESDKEKILTEFRKLQSKKK